MSGISRKEFLKISGAGLAGMVLPGAVGAEFQDQPATGSLTIEDIKTALKVANLTFEDDELKAVLASAEESRTSYPALRKAASGMNWPGCNYRLGMPTDEAAARYAHSVTTREVGLKRPDKDEDLAFLSVVELGYLIKTKQISSVDLTKIYIARLKKYGPKLRNVINLTEERAMTDAESADEQLSRGVYLGPLHGIPYGAKDLFDAVGYPTTWGCETFKDRMSNGDADIVTLLRAAGAVLVAKLSMGALAMGDVWWKGRTESPWDARVGSSGSSAGSASAVAAGLVPFAIGTETNGSIISPSHNCRVTGLRPTFGTISRMGAMALCWSLDKIGPICRDAEDCAVVYSALNHMTGHDPSQTMSGILYKSRKDLKGMNVGYLVATDEAVQKPVDLESKRWLKAVSELGAAIKPITLPAYPDAMEAILVAECSAAFEEFTRSPEIQDLEKYSTWPNTFRSGRLIPAVEYIQADRYRRHLAMLYQEQLETVDFVLADDRVYQRIYGLNLTGCPQILIPWGVDDRGRAMSCSLIGRPYSEDVLTSAAYAIQQKMGFHKLRPDMSQWA
ncbi:MAG: amidase [Fimbriimonadaceae bacterium]|nr:MAG: amidase [Fimbriimonadaceae bacterium]